MKKIKNSKSTNTNTATEAKASGCDHQADGAATLASLRSHRLAKYGRWAPLVAGYEQLVETALQIAEDAVRELPHPVATVRRFRTQVQLRLAGIADAPMSLADGAFTVRLLAQLAEHELRVPELTNIAGAFLRVLDTQMAPRKACPLGLRFVDSH